MQYRTMKKAGDRLSILGFGAMRIPISANRKVPLCEGCNTWSSGRGFFYQFYLAEEP